ncbi:hypothetical protein LQZ21_13875 [Treponema sp. TIM-1]|uniref:hypothetical protein n=1 Tax=Treponema sp. TIM-1 TaxID=2898417 RepID=UPI0039815F41
MKPYAKYIFKKLPNMATRYILREHSGNDIPNFPAFWKQKGHPHEGEGYIVFHETQNSRPRMRFTHALSLENNRMCTGFRFLFKIHTAYGDYGNDAMLIDFSDDWIKLTVWFFKDKKETAYFLFEKWTDGKLVLA